MDEKTVKIPRELAERILNGFVKGSELGNELAACVNPQLAEMDAKAHEHLKMMADLMYLWWCGDLTNLEYKTELTKFFRERGIK